MYYQQSIFQHFDNKKTDIFQSEIDFKKKEAILIQFIKTF